MKLINLYICLFSITFCNLFSQDIITKTDGTEIKAKILEINTNDIKYKKFNYQDGPTITILISDLNNIKYSNGEIESFKSPNKQNKIAANNDSENSSINKNGLIKTYYPTGELFSETNYLENKINGVQKLYFKNGNIISETNFINGYANGDSKIYHKNGELSRIVPYISGNITGEIKFYNKNGKFTGSANYIENKSYSKNGKLHVEYPYSNGNITGIVKGYNKNGNYEDIPYINNLNIGVNKVYNEDGKLLVQFEYEDGEKIINKSGYLNAVLLGMQGGLAYYNMQTNRNMESTEAYAKVLTNNIMKKPEDALNDNKIILSNTNLITNATAGSNATLNTNSTSSNSPLTDAFNKNMIELNKFYNTQHPDKPIDIYTNTVNYNNTQNSAESAAATNGGSVGGTNSGANGNTGDSKELAICGKQAEKLFENSQELKNMHANPNCNKMAYIAERRRVEIYLNNCRSLLPKSDIDGLTQGLAKMQAHINSMPDCQTIIYGK